MTEKTMAIRMREGMAMEMKITEAEMKTTVPAAAAEMMAIRL